MKLRQALRSSVAAITIASVAAPAGLAAPALETAPRGQVRVAQAKDFSRIEIAGRAVVRRDGQTLVLRLNQSAAPDVTQLKVAPPKWLKSAETRRAGGGLEVVLTLADNADAKIGSADGATFNNLFEKPPAPAKPAEITQAAAPAEAAPQPPRPNPIPAGGVVRMETRIGAGQVQLVFPWANPAGAAVFRRGEAVWVVFDAPATIDVSKAPRGLRQLTRMGAVRGTDYAAVRIDSPPGTPIFAQSQGATWTVILGPGAQVEAATQIRVVRDQAGGPAGLKAAVAGATKVLRVGDPVVGDTLSVVTALGPAKGLPSRREFVQMALLPSAQGLAAESYIEDLAVSQDGDLVQIGRPSGLTLSPASATTSRP